MSDFVTLPLESIVTLITEKAIGKKREDWRYVGLEHMATGSPDLLGTAPSSISVSTNCVFRKGDILFGKLRPNLHKCVVAPFSGYCSTDIIVLRANSRVASAFVEHLMRSDEVFRHAERTSIGTGMPRTAWPLLKNLRVRIPLNLRVQCRIAGILDTVDETIRATERLIEKLKSIKTGLLHDLLTHGIDENGRLRDPIAHPEEFRETQVGLRPAIWKFVRLDDFERAGNVQLGRGNVISHPAMEATPGDYPVYSSAATNNGQIGQYGKYMFDEALITWSVDGGGALFFRAKHKFSVTNVCGFLRIQNPIVEYRFLHAALVWQHERLTFDYTTKAHPSVVRQLYWVPVAPLAEQRKIGELLDRVDGSLAAEMRAAEKLRLLKRGLMNDLLTGKVRVLIDEEGDDE